MISGGLPAEEMSSFEEFLRRANQSLFHQRFIADIEILKYKERYVVRWNNKEGLFIIFAY